VYRQEQSAKERQSSTTSDGVDQDGIDLTRRRRSCRCSLCCIEGAQSATHGPHSVSHCGRKKRRKKNKDGPRTWCSVWTLDC